MATKVTLRKKTISRGRQSLYLDFYPAIPHPETGQPTRREFLNLYIFEKAKDPFDKMHNNETLRIAAGIRQKRENILNKPEIYTDFERKQLRIKELGQKCFVEYFRKLANKRKASNHDNWMSALNYLTEFTQGRLKFADLNETFLEGFKEYLLTTKSRKSHKASLSQNSALSYFNKIKATLKQAYKEGILQTDLNARVESIKEAETRRDYLSLEELNMLAQTPCNHELLKKAALFSALTGLRFSDIHKLIWGEIEYKQSKGYFLNYNQKKTKGVEVLPISEQAFELCGKRGDPEKKVFEGLNYSAFQGKDYLQWLISAGITKNITFHCFRHTYATLQLAHGTDIYTVSKMLGHRDLKTTQIYAKIVDESKRKAANAIKIKFKINKR